ncbi:hypothetical protein B0H17DRAFT_1181635 [Mycena rosella]|uniref:Uncharacterized protein n=1 Tax=Mycena rosella TaxID=1033263 RepID=A0AAD7GAD8_MYCRO|nr:hypothetical protein B0H17DRAFT_1181635 [Mycena rosella]
MAYDPHETAEELNLNLRAFVVLRNLDCGLESRLGLVQLPLLFLSYPLQQGARARDPLLERASLRDALTRRREMRLICGGVGRADGDALFCVRAEISRGKRRKDCVLEGCGITVFPHRQPCKAALHAAERRTRADRHTQTAPNAAHARWPADARAGSACAVMARARAWARDAAPGESRKHGWMGRGMDDAPGLHATSLPVMDSVDPKSTKEREISRLEAGPAHGAASVFPDGAVLLGAEKHDVGRIRELRHALARVRDSLRVALGGFEHGSAVIAVFSRFVTVRPYEDEPGIAHVDPEHGQRSAWAGRGRSDAAARGLQGL